MNIINKKKYKTDASRGDLNKNGAANKSHLHQTTPRSSNHEGSPDNGSSSSGTASTSSLTLSIINDNNNSNNNNLSPSSINNNSTTPTNTPDDQEAINHLENECLKLTFEMNKIRKYTQEWFILETKLNNATEELDAAREDRDLHFGVSSSEQQPMAEDSLLPVSSVVTPEEGEDNISVCCEEVKPSAIPNTLLLPNDAFTVGGEESPSSSLVYPVVSEQDGSYDCNVNGNTAISLGLERQRIESELASLLKFSPQWFQLKEELVEVCIALEDAAEEEGEIDKPTCEIAIVQTESTSINSMGAYQGLPPISPSSPSKQHRRFPSSPPLSPITRGSLSQVSSPNGRGSRLSSPYHSVTSNSQGHSRSSSFSSFNNNNPSTIYCHFFNDQEDCGEQQDIKRLEVEHAQTEERLHTLPQFSKEWFDVKTRLVGLSDQIDKMKRQEERQVEELRDCSFSSSSDSQTLRNQSGWSSTWSDSESEVMSFASDLELCMVGEALGQYTKYDDGLDEDEELLLDWENSKTEKHDHKESTAAVKIQSLFRGKLVHRQYMQACEKSIIIQTFIRSRLVRFNYHRMISSIICIQSVWRKLSHAKEAALLLDECKLVTRKLSLLMSVVKIQRAWRMHFKQIEVAKLLDNCEKVLLQLKKLEAVTVIQSYTRRWLIKSRQKVVSLYTDPHLDDESPSIDKSSLNFGTLRTNLENITLNKVAPTTPVISKEQDPQAGDMKTHKFEETNPNVNRSQCSQEIPKFSPEALRLAKQRIEYEISLHPRYSTRWFHWKEELVELNLVLDEAEAQN